MDFRIRQMQAADLPGVGACMDAAFGHPYNRDILAHEFKGCHRLNPNGLLVAVDNEGKVIGTAWGAWNGRRAVVSGLAVHPHNQGQGIARALMAEVERVFRPMGVTRLSVEIAPGNESVIPLYEHLGFSLKTGVQSMGKNLNNEDGSPLVEGVSVDAKEASVDD
ncbi:MAG: GNAT family N-acetyltransferase [Actinomycetaceae bacterium]|nr:GNAT family N-acetyltransferase [Actinomycetaceae bacterium]